MKNETLIRIIAVLVFYFLLKYFGGSFGRTVLYPVTLFVTFLHELGHALGALITGGSVVEVEVNPDGSGLTTTRGGWRAIVIMGGYLGSALLGNLIFYIGARKPKLSQWTLYLIATAMIITAIKWFSNPTTSGILIAFSVVIFIIANRTRYDQELMMFLGLASILYIIQDFRVGPSSDLNAYADLFKVIPANVWMYIWLVIALVLTFFNLSIIFRRDKRDRVSSATNQSSEPS